METPNQNSPLTPEEIELLYRVALGESNREISERFGDPPSVVGLRVSLIQQKLGVGDRTAAAKYGAKHGLFNSVM